MKGKTNRLQEIISSPGPLGFGSWALGGEYWGDQDHKDSIRSLHKALSLGIRHFDTAPVYGKGRSEQILGQQCRKIRGSVLLGSKVFYTDPERMRQSFANSLKRLMTDYLDIFYIHWPLTGTDMRPGMEILEELRREGRIRAIGVSNFSLDQIQMVEEAGKVDVYQGGYNPLWPVLEEEILPFLKQKEIGFIPYGVLAQGILTDKGLEKLRAKHAGFRHKMVLYNEDLKGDLLPFTEKLIRVCRENNIRTEQAVSLFTLKNTDADTVLLGTRNKKQAGINFTAPRTALPEEVEALLNKARSLSRKWKDDYPNMFNHIN